MDATPRRRIATFAAVIGISLLLYFVWKPADIGDGKLSDNGPFAAIDRYLVDLGFVNLGKKESHTYRLRNLPLETFVCGLEVYVPGFDGERLLDEKPLDATVLFEFLDNSGRVLLKTSAPLRKWGWGAARGDIGAFVYADYLHHSPCFTPTKGGSYQVTVAVVEPDHEHPNETARILMKSGGWK